VGRGLGHGEAGGEPAELAAVARHDVARHGGLSRVDRSGGG
jgi:hypothetical protein